MPRGCSATATRRLTARCWARRCAARHPGARPRRAPARRRRRLGRLRPRPPLGPLASDDAARGGRARRPAAHRQHRLVGLRAAAAAPRRAAAPVLARRRGPRRGRRRSRRRSACWTRSRSLRRPRGVVALCGRLRCSARFGRAGAPRSVAVTEGGSSAKRPSSGPIAPDEGRFVWRCSVPTGERFVTHGNGRAGAADPLSLDARTTRSPTATNERDARNPPKALSALVLVARAELAHLVAVPADLHVAPDRAAVARAVVERPLAVLGRAGLQPCPGAVALGVGDRHEQPARARRRRRRPSAATSACAVIVEATASCARAAAASTTPRRSRVELQCRRGAGGSRAAPRAARARARGRRRWHAARRARGRRASASAPRDRRAARCRPRGRTC